MNRFHLPISISAKLMAAEIASRELAVSDSRADRLTMNRYKNLFLATSAFVCMVALSADASAQAAPQAEAVSPEITVFASPEDYKTLAGSGSYLSAEDLAKFEDPDINSMLEEIPGLYIQEEDGFGLRPNIGMRAALSDRTAKVTVMEDGILIAPAPYAQPSAYYFPRAARMQGIEVVKGPASIRFGPYTTGGAINMISTQIPTANKGLAKLRVGSDGLADLHLNYGATVGNWGYLFETTQEKSDGFKKLPNGADTGFEIGSFLGKLRYTTDSGSQYFEFKYEYTDEVSDETYYGLTDTDFAADPFQRYAGTQVDEMDNEHWQTVLTHNYQFTSGATLKTQLYQTWFDRNWYKLSKVGGLSFSSATSDATLFSVLKGGNSAAECLAAPDTTNCSATDLAVKANNRQYETSGIQTQLNFTAGIHSFEIGMRDHTDEMTRIQWEDDDYMSAGTMALYNAGVPGASGGSNNRFEQAKAAAYYIYDDIDLGKLTITPGIRREEIDGKRVARLTNTTSHSSSISETLLGVGVTYEVSDSLLFVAGANDGFSATGVTKNEAETSKNFEAGFRYNAGEKKLEVMGFFTDFDNMIATCTVSSGCLNEGDTYDAGAVEVKGIELVASTVFITSGYEFPIQITYTYSDTEFQTAFSASLYELWGEVEAGDELPYVPEHQLGLSLGASIGKWDMNARVKYKSEQRTTAGQGSAGATNSIGSFIVTDLSASRSIGDNTKVNLYINNLFDNEYEVSRHPDGLRPGAPRSIAVGISTSF